MLTIATALQNNEKNNAGQPHAARHYFLEGWPAQALPRQIPPFVTYGDIFPRSGGSLSSKGEPRALPEASSFLLTL